LGTRLGIVAAAAAVLALVALPLTRRTPAFARGDVPVVAIAGMWTTGGDSADAWLADGMPRLLEAGLARASDIAVVPLENVEAVRARAELEPRAPIPDGRAIELGERVGATWVVRGAIARADTMLLLDLSVHATRDGRLLRRAVVSARDVFALADAAAARILALADGRREGPRLADLETSSTAAYAHFIRAVQASAAGRGSEEVAELDAAIALDSAFGSALLLRAANAWGGGDTATLRRVEDQLRRNRSRLSERDRLHWDAMQAAHDGRRQRAMQLLGELVTRYPRDPRGFAQLADLYYAEGRWADLQALLQRTLALDSLGLAAGEGPCVPCETYGRLVEIQWARGDRAGAERSARRWVQVQPGSANAHHHLAKVLARLGHADDAVAQMERAVSLAGNDPAQQLALARVLVMVRRYESADSLVRRWERDAATTPDSARRAQLLAQVADLRSVLALERGELRRGIADIDRTLRDDPRADWLLLIRGAMLARLGRFDEAEATYEEHAHRRSPLPRDASAARAFAWEHALLADAIAGRGDTVRLAAIADSLARLAPMSYFARDWRLHHHVRGLVAMRGGRLAEAERELQAARWGIAGWTRTVAELARAQMAQGRPLDAVRTLRDAIDHPDAMARYLAVSEVDRLRACAFGAAGLPDSAAAYRERARRAWRRADPEVRRLLDRC
jgi:tetratricopeptide (TPR) repeat protein